MCVRGSLKSIFMRDPQIQREMSFRQVRNKNFCVYISETKVHNLVYVSKLFKTINNIYIYIWIYLEVIEIQVYFQLITSKNFIRSFFWILIYRSFENIIIIKNCYSQTLCKRLSAYIQWIWNCYWYEWLEKVQCISEILIRNEINNKWI